MLMSTKVDCTVMLNLSFQQFFIDFIVHSIFNGVVMTFVINIGGDLHWLWCCCLYFKRNLPLLLCFFKSYCTCQLLISSFARFKN